MGELFIKPRTLKSGKTVYEYAFEIASVDGKRKRKTKSGFATKREAREAGKIAQVTKDFMIIARIEEIIAGYSVDEAITKAFAAVRAGADGVMIHSKDKSGEDIKEFCQKFRAEYKNIPIVLVPTTYWTRSTYKMVHMWCIVDTQGYAYYSGGGNQMTIVFTFSI